MPGEENLNKNNIVIVYKNIRVILLENVSKLSVKMLFFIVYLNKVPRYMFTEIYIPAVPLSI